MKGKNRKWVLAALAVITLLMMATIVWAAPPASEPSAPLQATPGFDADKVDGHHAAASWWSTSQRRYRVLWANANGRLHWKAMPQTALNNRYLRRDDVTLLALNPFEIEPTSEIAANGGLNFLHHWLGYTQMWNDSFSQGTIYVPVHNFTTAFGSPLKLDSIDVCYQVASGSYISRTKVFYANNAGGRTEILDSTTNRTSTSWDCYTVTNTTPVLVEGPILVYFMLWFGGNTSSDTVGIGQITLTLVE